MKKLFILLGTIATFSLLVFFVGCDKEEDELKAEFTIDDTDPNRPIFTCTNDEADVLTYAWDFGNGLSSAQRSDTIFYPVKGDYKITLTITTSSDPLVATKTYTVTSNDATACGNAMNVNLTGGCSSNDGKVWVLSNAPGHISVGPSANIPGASNPDGTLSVDYKNDPIDESWFQWPVDHVKNDQHVDSNDVNDGLASCAYEAKATFKMDGQYKNDDGGKSIINWAFYNTEFAASATDQVVDYREMCADVSGKLDLEGSWEIKSTTDGYFLELSGSNFLPYYQGGKEYVKYQILALTDKLLCVRYPFYDDGADATRNNYQLGFRYVKYVPEGMQDDTTIIPGVTLSIDNPPTE